jgi:F0F1-type ATP synthase membrane subunit c/vacuolar-type H+-ATPase subunit K
MAEQVRQLRIIWIAFLIAVAVYTPIPFLLVADGEGGTAPVPATLRSGMNFAALGAGVASILARRWWTNSLHAALQRDGAAQVSADPWARLRAGCIISWALSEAVALIGLALAIVTRTPTEGAPFAAGAAALLLYHRPSNWPIDATARGARPG